MQVWIGSTITVESEHWSSEKTLTSAWMSMLPDGVLAETTLRIKSRMWIVLVNVDGMAGYLLNRRYWDAVE